MQSKVSPRHRKASYIHQKIIFRNSSAIAKDSLDKEEQNIGYTIFKDMVPGCSIYTAKI